MTPYIEAQQGRVHPGAARDGPPTTASTGASPRPPTRPSSTTAPTRSRTVPATWQEVYEQAKAEGRHRLPGRAVRGPDLRLPRAGVRAPAARCSPRTARSRRSTRRENVKALQFMVDGIKDGAAPKAVTTYMEPESLARLRDAASTRFMRNWPYAYAARQEGDQGQGQVRGRAAAGVRGRRQGRHPRRPQQRHLACTRRTRAAR